MSMTVDPELLKWIEQIIEEKIEKKLKSIRLTSFGKRFLTREDLRVAMERLDKQFEARQQQRERLFESKKKQMNKKFQIMQQRDRLVESKDHKFEEVVLQMNKGFEEARQDRKELRDFLSKGSTVRIKQLQKAVLELMNDRLIQEAIPVEKITKEYLVDKKGQFFYENYSTDIYILIENGKTVLINIIAHADNRDVNELLKKAELFKLLRGKDYDSLILLCLEINQRNFEDAIRQNIRVIAGSIT